MSRSRRRGRSPVLRKHTDWVYRANVPGLTVAPLNIGDNLGTYDFSVRGLTTGVANAQALWLVDAADKEQSVYRSAPGAAGIQSMAAKPEGPRTKVLAVEGIIYFEPSTWAAGNLMAMGVRIMAIEQDIVTSVALVDSDMTMWNTTSAGFQDAASRYANDKQLNMYEQRMFKSFGDNGSIMVMRIRARINWTLQSRHGLALWLEGESTSVNVRYQTWLRTLVQK